MSTATADRRPRGDVVSEEEQGFLLKLEFSSAPELLSVVRGAVHQLGAVVGLAEVECRSVTLAVDEALANIIRHAYGNQPGQPIELSCRLLGPDESGRHAERLEFHLVDQGRGIDPAEMRGRPLGEVRPGGLGTHFIKEIMDEVEYERAGAHNHLRLIKYLPEARSRSRQ